MNEDIMEMLNEMCDLIEVESVENEFELGTD